MITIFNKTSHLPRFLNGLENIYRVPRRYPLGFPIFATPNSDYYANLVFTEQPKPKRMIKRMCSNINACVVMRAARARARILRAVALECCLATKQITSLEGSLLKVLSYQVKNAVETPQDNSFVSSKSIDK